MEYFHQQHEYLPNACYDDLMALRLCLQIARNPNMVENNARVKSFPGNSWYSSRPWGVSSLALF